MCCNSNTPTPAKPVATPTPPVVQLCTQCTLAQITRPHGSLDSTGNPTSSWSGSAPYHFDFQGVVSGSPGPYSLSITGNIAPSCFTCGWTLEAAAGTLSSTTVPSPTHTSPVSAGEGMLRLVAMLGSAPFPCRDQKKLKIYPDHLARDEDNFGTGISCQNTWTFTKFGTAIRMPSTWNCFGSVDHHYNGSGNGYTPSVNIPLGWSSAIYDAPISASQWTAINSSLRRGDVVSFWSDGPSGHSAQHAHTSMGGTSMYGANNEPAIMPTGHPATWRWFISTSRTYFDNVNSNPRTLNLLTRVIVHRKH